MMYASGTTILVRPTLSTRPPHVEPRDTERAAAAIGGHYTIARAIANGALGTTAGAVAIARQAGLLQ